MDDSTLPCIQYQELYDSDGLTPSIYQNAVADGLDADIEHRTLSQAVDDTIEAIDACYHCPILEQCRADTAQRIADGSAPAGIVQAGVYWGADHRPDWTLNGCISSAQAAAACEKSGFIQHTPYRVDDHGVRWPLTVPIFRDHDPSSPCASQADHTGGPIDAYPGEWDVSWLPALTEPVDAAAVAAVVRDRQAYRYLVPAAKVRRCRDLADQEREARGREQLSDAEVCEALRQMTRDEVAVSDMAARLSLSYGTTRSVLARLGIAPQTSEVHRQAALERERRRAERRELQILQRPLYAESDSGQLCLGDELARLIASA